MNVINKYMINISSLKLQKSDKKKLKEAISGGFDQ